MSAVPFPFARFEALLFDMDGTLVDNMGAHRRAWLEWAQREGISGSESQILARTHGTIFEIAARFFPDASPAEQRSIGARKEALYREIYRGQARVLPGLLDLLEWARQESKPIALATAGDRVNIEFVLGQIGLSDRFDAIIGAEQVERGKPDPDVFERAARALGVDPARSLVFEDSPAGVEAARRAGSACAVVNAMNPRADFGQAAHVVAWARDFRGLAHDPWRVLDSRPVYDNAWMQVREDRVVRPDGQESIYGVMAPRNRAVGVVPLHADGTITLVGQWRFPQREWSWEIPEGGGLFDEEPSGAARRELREETGLVADELEPLGGELRLSNSLSDEIGFLFLARDPRPGPSSPEATEQIITRRLSLEAALAMANTGEISDALTIIALHRTRDLLASAPANP